MRLLDTLAHQIETAHSVEARRAARFARDFAFPVSGVMSDQLAACDGAATAGAFGGGLHADAPMVPACIAAQTRFALAEGDKLDAMMRSFLEFGRG